MSNVNSAAPPAFSHLKFPPYEFREFPKMVKDHTGKDVIVESASEELSVLRAARDAETTTDETAASPEASEEVETETVEVELPRGRRRRQA